jgi:GntR family histidine utilization transcriptional repressor
VAPSHTPVAVLRIPVVRDEIEARGGIYAYLLLERKVAAPPAPVRAVFGLAADAPALHLRSLHFENARPYQLEDRWINLGARPTRPSRTSARAAPTSGWCARCPIRTSSTCCGRRPADAATAEALQIEPGSPVFVIERTTWMNDDAVTRVSLMHPGESFRIVTRDW